MNRILLSAAKQSLKASIPELSDTISVREFIESTAGTDALKMIAYCFEDGQERHSIREVLEKNDAKEVIVLIGPEGDFPGKRLMRQWRQAMSPYISESPDSARKLRHSLLYQWFIIEI